MRFSEETEARTAECLRELWATTTEEKLLRAAGGNKWIARRAIELYKLGFPRDPKRLRLVVDAARSFTRQRVAC